jgi:hypothetical protein
MRVAAALVSLALPAAVFAQQAGVNLPPTPPAPGGITTREIYRGYAEATRPEYRRAEILSRLNQVCASPSRSDKRRCDRAWKIINRAKAKLDARNAAVAE